MNRWMMDPEDLLATLSQMASEAGFWQMIPDAESASNIINSWLQPRMRDTKGPVPVHDFFKSGVPIPVRRDAESLVPAPDEFCSDDPDEPCHQASESGN